MTAAIKQNHNLNVVHDYFKKSISVKQSVLESDCLNQLPKMAEIISNSIKNNGKLLLCGNGGSAADAQHLAAELLIRLRPHVNRQALPAMTLATDISTITACGNDYSFDDIFARPLEALGNKGDVLLAITTSGKSENVLRALKIAQNKGITTIALLGNDGGPALSYCDYSVVIPSNLTGHIQECHITAGHILMQLVEEAFI